MESSNSARGWITMNGVAVQRREWKYGINYKVNENKEEARQSLKRKDL